MGRKCKAIVYSGAQVTVINKDCFNEYMRGKQSRPIEGCCRRSFSYGRSSLMMWKLRWGYFKEESSFSGKYF